MHYPKPIAHMQTYYEILQLFFIQVNEKKHQLIGGFYSSTYEQ